MHIPDIILANKAQSIFPKAIVVHMIRKPLQSLGSHFKRYMNPAEGVVTNIPVHDYVNKLFAEQMDGDTPLVECRPVDDEFAIRLEDIHSSPRETMAKVAGRLDVSWSESLLESTLFGKVMEWKSSSHRNAIVGFTTKHLRDDHPDVFSFNDVKFIEGLFFENYKKWGYEPANFDTSDENRRDFVENRIAIPLQMEVMCWERACQEGASRHEIINSYNSLRDALEKRFVADVTLLNLL
jgi:hypothetical protein